MPPGTFLARIRGAVRREPRWVVLAFAALFLTYLLRTRG